jgi:hypothetical protein
MSSRKTPAKPCEIPARHYQKPATSGKAMTDDLIHTLLVTHLWCIAPEIPLDDIDRTADLRDAMRH